MFRFRFASAILTLFVTLGSVFIPFIPQKSEALTVFDIPNTIQGVFNNIANTANSIQTYWLQYKESILDGIAYYVAKAVIRQITTSLVQWINDGFRGSPSFIANPGRFFKGMIDEEIGAFIEGSPLGFLCDGFNIDLRFQLAINYRPFKRRVTCTLSEVFGNIEGAAENFTRANFTSGGWSGWASVSTQPQNNRYGAMLEAENQLGLTLNGKQLIKTKELDWGKGFLSWKRCRPTNGLPAQPQGSDFVGPPTPQQAATQRLQASSSWDQRYGQGASSAGDLYRQDAQYNATPEGTAESIRECGSPGQLETTTPGNMISNGLEHAFGSPIRELELADEFNEIINALMVQMLKMAFGQGNGMLNLTETGSGSNGGRFIDDIDRQDFAALDRIRTDMTPRLNTALTLETEYRNMAQTAVADINAVRALFTNARACLAREAAAGDRRSVRTGAMGARIQGPRASELIRQLDAYATSTFNPEIAAHETAVNTALTTGTANIATFANLQVTLRAATTSQGISNAALQFSNIYNPSRRSDILTLTNQRNDILSVLQSHRQRALEFQRDCDSID